MSNSRKTIAITGSSGFIGTHLIEQLNLAGYNIIPLDIKNGIDLTNWESVKQIPEFDVIIHLAARLFVPESYEFPREFYTNNIVSTLNLLDLCKIYSSKMIFASSYIYGSPQYLPIDEEHPISAFNPYSESKILCERLCDRYNKDFDVPVIIFRPFNIYGKGQDEKFLIPFIIKQAKTGKIILNDPNPKRDMVFVDDVVNAYIRAIEYDNSSFEVFNIGFGKSYSVKEITEMISGYFNENIEIRYKDDKRLNEVSDTIANIDKAKKLLSWEPKVSLQEGFAKTICN